MTLRLGLVSIIGMTCLPGAGHMPSAVRGHPPTRATAVKLLPNLQLIPVLEAQRVRRPTRLPSPLSRSPERPPQPVAN